MVCVLPECLGSYVPTLPCCPSPPYSCSLSSSTSRIARIEEGDSRDSVEKESPLGVWETLGYVAKLDEIAKHNHGSSRAKSATRSNSWWVSSLTGNSNDLLPEEGRTEGVGKYWTRKEAVERLIVAKTQS